MNSKREGRVDPLDDFWTEVVYLYWQFMGALVGGTYFILREVGYGVRA